MQRFYCTTCDTVKRVQVAPVHLEFLRDIPVKDRIGQCRAHLEMKQGDTRARINHRGKVRTPLTAKGKGLSASQAKSKSKKG